MGEFSIDRKIDIILSDLKKAGAIDSASARRLDGCKMDVMRVLKARGLIATRIKFMEGRKRKVHFLTALGQRCAP